MRFSISFILSVLLLSGCAASTIIPEISSELTYKEIYDNKSAPIIGMASDGKNLFLFSGNGIVYTLDPVKNTLIKIADAKEKIIKKIHFQNGIVALKTGGITKTLFFDLENLRFLNPNINKERIAGIFKDIFLTISGKEFSIRELPGGKEIKKIRSSSKKFFNAEIINDSMIILQKKSLIVYDIKKQSLETVPLAESASSPFLFSGGFLYYGSVNRKLIKYSFKKRKKIWAINTPMIIKKKIKKSGKFIVTLPEDHGIYFFTRKGSLHWWKKLDSEILDQPVLMNSNIAIHLKDAEKDKIAFLDPLKKRLKSIILDDFSLEDHLTFFNGYIFSIGKNQDKDYNTLLKIGNKIGGIVEIPGKKEFETGKSVKISVIPVNMIEPEINILVKESGGKIVLSKKYISKQKVNMAWIPDKEGTFKIDVILNENGLSVKEEEIEIRVNNFEKMYKKYFISLIGSCGFK